MAIFNCYVHIKASCYLFANFQVLLSKVHGLIMVPQCSVSISKTPACTTLSNPRNNKNKTYRNSYSCGTFKVQQRSNVFFFF